MIKKSSSTGPCDTGDEEALTRLTYDLYAGARRQCRQELTAHKRLGFDRGKRPEAGCSSSVLRLRRPIGSDRGELFDLAADDSNAAADSPQFPLRPLREYPRPLPDRQQRGGPVSAVVSHRRHPQHFYKVELWTRDDRQLAPAAEVGLTADQPSCKRGWRFGASPTSIFLSTESFCINGLGRKLVTMCGFNPCVLGGDRLRGDGEVAIDLLDFGFGRGSLADAQT